MSCIGFSVKGCLLARIGKGICKFCLKNRVFSEGLLRRSVFFKAAKASLKLL